MISISDRRVSSQGVPLSTLCRGIVFELEDEFFIITSKRKSVRLCDGEVFDILPERRVIPCEAELIIYE